ncbi:hypothetical protein [Oceanobacillus kimchii]|uniref:hypothetical protein n=1 Tax=Oceanobacillus kimchii TaxID=746691 RepID=UPI003C709A44
MSFELGVQLAKEFVLQEKRISDIIKNKEYQFDVWEEDGKAYLQTAICNVGGCTAEFLTFDSLEEAKKQAAIMTLNGKKMKTVSICSECENELKPMWDDAPNFVKYCSKCG